MSFSGQDCVVAYANRYQFAGSQIVDHPSVGSRMLLWALAGQVQVMADDRPFTLEDNGLLILPWRHRIRYRADARRPALVAGVHLIPCHDRRVPVCFEVPHHPRHPLYQVAWRRDVALEGLEAPVLGRISRHPVLRHLAEAAVEMFGSGAPDEEVARWLGSLLLHEMARFHVVVKENPRLSEPLELAMAAVLERLSEPLTLRDLASAAGRSPSGVIRLFRVRLGVTPMDWLKARRIESAQRLLAETGLRVSEVGRRVGIPDPFHFSRLFKEMTDLSPRAWRRQRVTL